MSTLTQVDEIIVHNKYYESHGYEYLSRTFVKMITTGFQTTPGFFSPETP